jgi:hypothetical protein
MGTIGLHGREVIPRVRELLAVLPKKMRHDVTAAPV